MEKTMYAVIGTPSGGTSAVAGVLRCLGVEMLGSEDVVSQFRLGFPPPLKGVAWWHESNECHALNAIMERYWPMGALSAACDDQEAVRMFDKYIELRVQHGCSMIGFKDPRVQAILSLYSELPEWLKVVIVDRPLEDSVRSWRFKQQRMGLSNGRQIKGAAFVASMWAMKCDVAQRFPIHSRVSYPGLLSDPREEIAAMAQDLGLPTLNLDAAIASITEFKRK